jgi:hypothetical protein
MVIKESLVPKMDSSPAPDYYIVNVASRSSISSAHVLLPTPSACLYRAYIIALLTTLFYLNTLLGSPRNAPLKATGIDSLSFGYSLHRLFF